MNKKDRIKIDPEKVSVVEYAMCKSEADMCLYEVYYINMFHPVLNDDAKASDDLTVSLPPLVFMQFPMKSYLDEWRRNSRERIMEKEEKDRMIGTEGRLIEGYKQRYLNGEISREDYIALCNQAKAILGSKDLL